MKEALLISVPYRKKEIGKNVYTKEMENKKVVVTSYKEKEEVIYKNKKQNYFFNLVFIKKY